MPEFPKKLDTKLNERAISNSMRGLPASHKGVDFSSNDYLGFAKNETIYASTFQLLLKKGITENGASGSRLISGNHSLYTELELLLEKYHKAEGALIFNSGYDANLGFFSAIPQRNDIIFYDELVHASIRDGIKLGNAKSHKFKHNDLEDLKSKFKAEHSDTTIYVVTESVFSMDGDTPDLVALTDFCKDNDAYLVVDEAHAVGVLGKYGEGLVQGLGIEKDIFARIITFGKALGGHGACILGSTILKTYLINFARSFIYTTGLPPHSLATMLSAYEVLSSTEGKEETKKLEKIISFFKKKVADLTLEYCFVKSDSAIQSCIVPGNSKVKEISEKLLAEGFDVKAILAPTVTEGQERLRFCLHSYNTTEEIGWVLHLLKKHY